MVSCGKKIFTILTAAGLLFSCAIPAISADLKNEFLGIEWGADISKLKGFTELQKRGDVVYYVNYDKSYQINNLDLPPVIYGAYQGEFFAAYIRLDTVELFDQINSYMNSKYGLSVVKVRSGHQVHKWKYEKVKIKLLKNRGNAIIFFSHFHTGRGIVFLPSSPP